MSENTAENAFIRCVGVTKVYHKGDQEIVPLRDLELTIARGSWVSLMGPSGSGKTTLLNLLAGIDSATRGQLWIGDHDLARMTRDQLASWRAQQVGIIFQSYNLVPVLTAYENVELPLLLQTLTRRERARRVNDALAMVDLTDRAGHFPSQLSGGQEQRVAIARAIVADPPLLLADEPTGDLDRVSADMVLTLLDTLHRTRGRTIVMVTHDPDAASRAEIQFHLDKGVLAHTVQRNSNEVTRCN
ncbi:MAG: ABC transporter ATP-binding protein [Planctomycetota bacterium]|jgi:putative ABC transport system ATP-binding protein|nr:MAG: ABC transporter ATP-binding protein [Planctomycetota bacterium]RLS93926.1 MAG: ABC transporter ATP-binding protein [Planctomycetota bacterium]